MGIIDDINTTRKLINMAYKTAALVTPLNIFIGATSVVAVGALYTVSIYSLGKRSAEKNVQSLEG